MSDNPLHRLLSTHKSLNGSIITPRFIKSTCQTTGRHTKLHRKLDGTVKSHRTRTSAIPYPHSCHTPDKSLMYDTILAWTRAIRFVRKLNRCPAGKVVQKVRTWVLILHILGRLLDLDTESCQTLHRTGRHS